ncbi:MAG: hypothetical protein G5663_01440 [Serratia symbiotica]|nr:hypothetical protein [Serratia symbiotica]
MSVISVLMLKRIFCLTLRTIQGLLDGTFTLMKVPSNCQDYTCISKRAKSVNVPFKIQTPGEFAHLVIKHGQGKRRIYRKLHLAVIVSSEVTIRISISGNSNLQSKPMPYSKAVLSE